MTRRRYPQLWRVASLAASLVAAACGGESESPTAPPAPAPIPDPGPGANLLLPDDPAAVLLEVWVHGGLLPPYHSLNLPPIYWLTAGGTLYLPHKAPPVWPPPLLSFILETRLSDAEFEAALGEIAASGLPDAEEEQVPVPGGGIPEVLTTELIFRDRVGQHVIRVEALHEPHTDPRVAHLRALLELFAAASGEFTEYPADRLQVITVFDAPPQDLQDRDERPWPLPDPPQRDEGRSFACQVFGGEVAAGLIETFTAAFETTLWVHAGERMQLLTRPLFPGEAGCRT